MNIREIAGPLYSAKFWLQLVGVMMVIYGVLVAITIVGIIVAWLPIWLGVLLFQAAKAVEQAYTSEDGPSLLAAMGKLKTYFTIMGVLTLIGLIFAVASFFLGGIAGLMGA